MRYKRWLVLAGVTIWIAVLTLPDDKVRVIFCDVGQGDAILVTYKTNQLLIDGGPGKKVLSCLERHMPFYDRRIEAVVLTHENSDHSRGLEHVRQRYRILVDTPALYRGQVLEIGPVRFLVKWPERWKQGETGISSDNNLAIVGRIVFGDFDVFLTSDAPSEYYPDPGRGIEVVKVPHHGSRYGWDAGWWNKVRPALAVISVGKNSFGHPTDEVINTLNDLGIRLLRTDTDGEIEIVSDGERWWITPP